MNGYTAAQIRDHYRRSILTRSSRGPFTPEEDGLLLALHQKYGPCWRKMQDYFKRKSTDVIRERYLNALVPDRKFGPWSLQEDKLLIAMIKKYGYGQWTKISKTLSGRSDQSCLSRAKYLLKWSIDNHSEKGMGEYDPGVYDPALFAKLLRTLPKSKYRNVVQVKKQRPKRENALKALAKALEVVAPEYVTGIKDLNSINVSCMSEETLDALSDVLHASLLETEAKATAPPKYLSKPLPLRKRVEPESDDENYTLPPEEKVPQEEKVLIQSAMLKLLEMQKDVKQPVLRKTSNFSTRQWAEMSLYTDYLYKQFNCKTLSDKDSNQEKVMFGEVDYRESLPNVTRNFIQPPVYDKQFLILAPNLSTMTGMEMIEATENRLLSMSQCASHSKSYIDYLCERRKNPPQCLQCLRKSEEISPELIISDMKKKSFLLDKRLETTAYVEGASNERLGSTCVCSALDDSIKSVQLLRKRFLSLLMWPALISEVGFSDKQEHIICIERPKEYNYFLNMRTIPMNQKRKRRRNLERQAAKKLKVEESESELSSESFSEESGSELLEELLSKFL